MDMTYLAPTLPPGYGGGEGDEGRLEGSDERFDASARRRDLDASGVGILPESGGCSVL